ncbi:MAG: tyrosine-type recombinase/integrase [Acaryochloris sp. RU_4_1]|nr:tyrosine-type recombinase/integrase [Acaryochloris sp. RU_4_1]NJR57068.1 tyrosine-type recombinase/integrase [Acaryochloris sp. CRU_2_0]
MSEFRAMDSVSKPIVPVVKLVLPKLDAAEVAEAKVVAIAQAQPELVKTSRLQKIEMFLQAKSFAENTCCAYRRQLTAFIDWVGKDWERVELADLTRYQQELEGRSLKKTSKAAALIAIKSLYSWLKKSGQLAVNPSDGITIPVIEVGESKHLEPDEVARLFAALDGRKTERRDRAILLLWFNAGLRAEEVTKLNVGDYNNVEVTVREAKHGSSGVVPTDDETHAAIVTYLVQRTNENGGMLSEDDPLFVSCSHRSFGKRLSYEGVYKILKKIAAAAGLENVHPHRGRHTFSSSLLENGVDAYLAMPLMRQRSLKAFNTYNNKVRQKAAREAFWQAKGVIPRNPSSVQQMVKAWTQGEAPGRKEAIALEVDLEAVVEEPSNWLQVKPVAIPLNAVYGIRVYQLKIKLLGVRPQVWRRIQVPETATLTQLHSVVQVVMGWEGYHLHEFSLSEDETITLAKLLGNELFTFTYLYDFGDMWQHEITVEKRLASEPGKDYPVCLAGKRACPPEDCGGDWGYAHLLKVLKNRRHPEYRERKEWVGKRFDPEAFDLEEVNQALRELRSHS